MRAILVVFQRCSYSTRVVGLGATVVDIGCEIRLPEAGTFAARVNFGARSPGSPQVHLQGCTVSAEPSRFEGEIRPGARPAWFDRAALLQAADEYRLAVFGRLLEVAAAPGKESPLASGAARVTCSFRFRERDGRWTLLERGELDWERETD